MNKYKNISSSNVQLQNRSESGVMIRGFIALIVLVAKKQFNFEFDSEIVDLATELTLATYAAWAIRNSPRIKGEY